MLSSHVSRRTVARGAAWSVPLVAVSITAPAFAASITRVTATGITVCQCAGGGVKRYQVTVTFTNSTADPIDLTNVVISEAGAAVPAQEELDRHGAGRRRIREVLRHAGEQRRERSVRRLVQHEPGVVHSALHHADHDPGDRHLRQLRLT